MNLLTVSVVFSVLLVPVLGCLPVDYCPRGNFTGIGTKDYTKTGNITCKGGEASPSHLFLGCNIEIVTFQANWSIVEDLIPFSFAALDPFITCVGNGTTSYLLKYKESYPICDLGTPEPTPEPVVQTLVPTEEPTLVPTQVPTAEPTAVPTFVPTEIPTFVPTQSPTSEPLPTLVPTQVPTRVPTQTPVLTQIPTGLPIETSTPTRAPTTQQPATSSDNVPTLMFVLITLSAATIGCLGGGLVFYLIKHLKQKALEEDFRRLGTLNAITSV
eukprot:TRINITY_DN1342_c0_g1_i14.p1 TRINITY_DN1342_c0_g1~~TRINITY_DN1342_c0_g1_i14.p1  ORF type:complete len:271 (+),score=54.18 TRINITY_DN1342_c0_g1_i14:54-866(+)